MLSAVDRVERGVVMLDMYGPEGWRDMVEPGRLNIESSFDCVLGQVFGSYSAGVIWLRERVGSFIPSYFGFAARDMVNYSWESREADYEALRVEWVRVLSQ